jgi:hypothetical protein
MDKARPTNARPEANIGRRARQNLGNCSHSKWSVIRPDRPSTARSRHRYAAPQRNAYKKQLDGWLTLSEENRLDLRQTHREMLPFEFA